MNEPVSISERIRIAEKENIGVPFELRPPIPKNMMIELSNACNHSCIFCANQHMQRKISKIDPSLMETIMGDAASLGVKEIGFYTTGDPLSHRDLEKFTSSAKAKGFQYAYISTNGAGGGSARFKAIIDAGMDSIKFSINAGTRESYKMIHGHDHWDRVIENLKFVSEYRKTLSRKLSLFATYVVTKQTEHEQNQFRDLISPLVDEIVFSPCGSQSGNMSGANSILGFQDTPHVKMSNTAICNLPFNRIHVTCEGYLTLCCVDYQNYLAVADLKQNTLLEAWHSEAFANARKMHLVNKLSGTLCGNCWYGRKDKIEPLDAELSSPIDFGKLYLDQLQVTEERIATHVSLPNLLS